MLVHVLSASVPFHAKPHQTWRDFLRQGESAAPKGVSLPKVSRPPQGGGSLAPPRIRAGKERQARCSLGIVVKAA